MRPSLPSLALASLVLALAACGGGSGGSPTTSGTQQPDGAAAGAVSSGTVTAFGSVFVNGHEFSTAGATVVDDDTGSRAAGTSALEVGMSVDVKAASDSTSATPKAAEIHLHPLARGVVDGSDTGAGTLVVMGQKVQLTASTNFSDHRACLAAATPCTAITGQSDLTATSASGAGHYVTVHGYLFSATGGAGDADIVATLISVADAPTAPRAIAYKAEGVVSAASGSSITIGSLAVDLSGAKCAAAGAAVDCASAYAAGDVVAVAGATAPTLPATSFAPSLARKVSKLALAVAGTPMEIEGQVSAVTTTPPSFVVRGVTVDGSALASLPAKGDFVRVTGTVAADGNSVAATALKVLHTAVSATFGFEGDAAGVVAGSAAGTWQLTLLGQTVTVNAATRLADWSKRGVDPAANPFNASTFQTYLAASASQHLLVRTQADAAGALTALSVTIVPASSGAGVGGTIDAAPAPANGSTATTFSVHGLAVSADPLAIVKAAPEHDGHGFGGMVTIGPATVAAGDLVLARGTWDAASSTLKVAAPVPATDKSRLSNFVFDYGAPRSRDRDGF